MLILLALKCLLTIFYKLFKRTSYERINFSYFDSAQYKELTTATVTEILGHINAINALVARFNYRRT